MDTLKRQADFLDMLRLSTPASSPSDPPSSSLPSPPPKLPKDIREILLRLEASIAQLLSQHTEDPVDAAKHKVRSMVAGAEADVAMREVGTQYSVSQCCDDLAGHLQVEHIIDGVSCGPARSFTLPAEPKIPSCERFPGLADLRAMHLGLTNDKATIANASECLGEESHDEMDTSPTKAESDDGFEIVDSKEVEIEDNFSDDCSECSFDPADSEPQACDDATYSPDWSRTRIEVSISDEKKQKMIDALKPLVPARSTLRRKSIDYDCSDMPPLEPVTSFPRHNFHQLTLREMNFRPDYSDIPALEQVPIIPITFRPCPGSIKYDPDMHPLERVIPLLNCDRSPITTPPSFVDYSDMPPLERVSFPTTPRSLDVDYSEMPPLIPVNMSSPFDRLVLKGRVKVPDLSDLPPLVDASEVVADNKPLVVVVANDSERSVDPSPSLIWTYCQSGSDYRTRTTATESAYRREAIATRCHQLMKKMALGRKSPCEQEEQVSVYDRLD
ncbi:hypothetical protein P7C70_g7512, partial [Phenoliferia sp. Uapishka_3]